MSDLMLDGDRGLAAFLQHAEHTLLATLAETGYEKCTSILFHTSAMLDALSEHYFRKHPEPKFTRIMLLRAKGAFYGAARLALSGQLPESYMVARGALEAALFGYLVHASPELEQVWHDRHESEDSLKPAKKEFSATKAFDMLKKNPGSDTYLEPDLSYLYEDLIDWGGHPNVLSVTPHFSTEQRIIDIDEDTAIRETIGSIAYINTDPKMMHRFIRRIIQTGIGIVRLYSLMEPNYIEELGFKKQLADAEIALWREEIHPPHRF